MAWAWTGVEREAGFQVGGLSLGEQLQIPVRTEAGVHTGCRWKVDLGHVSNLISSNHNRMRGSFCDGPHFAGRSAGALCGGGTHPRGCSGKEQSQALNPSPSDGQNSRHHAGAVPDKAQRQAPGDWSWNQCKTNQIFAHEPGCARLCLNPGLLTRPAGQASPIPRWWQMSGALGSLEALKRAVELDEYNRVLVQTDASRSREGTTAHRPGYHKGSSLLLPSRKP